jgi:hypothetical protein
MARSLLGLCSHSSGTLLLSGPTAPPTGLLLGAGQTYAAIVNVVSTENAPMKLAAPANAENSYLYLKITGRPATGTQVQPPPGTSSVLSTDQKNIVRDWINAGAKNDEK